MRSENMSARGLTRLTPRAKLTKGQTRSNNLRLALQIIFDKAPTSRAEVARESNLTPATASGLVDQLIELDLVESVGTGPSAGGKPPMLIAPNPEGRQIIALDLSSSTFRGSLLGLTGETELTVERVGATHDEAVAVALEIVRELAGKASAPILGVGIGAPGVVDNQGGTITSANLHWDDEPVAEAFASVIDAPIHLINDAHGAALAEYARADIDASNMVLVRVGFGVGAGYVLDGYLYRGEHAAAGEIGHVRTDADEGALCSCGSRGCLETKASMSALIADVGGDRPLTRAYIEELAADPSAQDAIARAAIELGRVFSTVVAAFAVNELTIWGEATSLGENYRLAVQDEIRKRVLAKAADRIEVRYATTGEDAVLLGAAALVLSAELGVVW